VALFKLIHIQVSTLHNGVEQGIQARNQLGTPGGAKSFLRGGKFFKLCPIALKYVQHIFPGGGKVF